MHDQVKESNLLQITNYVSQRVMLYSLLPVGKKKKKHWCTLDLKLKVSKSNLNQLYRFITLCVFNCFILLVYFLKDKIKRQLKLVLKREREKKKACVELYIIIILNCYAIITQLEIVHRFDLCSCIVGTVGGNND